MIDSIRMLLDWLGRRLGIAQAVDAALAMGQATTLALADASVRTRDIRGSGTTTGMTDAIVATIGR